MSSSPTRIATAQPTSSPSSIALLSLTQDVTALISLSLEATASLVHDWFRSTLGVVGLGQVVPYVPRRMSESSAVQLPEGRGMAAVVIGASEGERPFHSILHIGALYVPL